MVMTGGVTAGRKRDGEPSQLRPAKCQAVEAKRVVDCDGDPAEETLAERDVCQLAERGRQGEPLAEDLEGGRG